jgi:hypothetical protein
MVLEAFCICGKRVVVNEEAAEQRIRCGRRGKIPVAPPPRPEPVAPPPAAATEGEQHAILSVCHGRLVARAPMPLVVPRATWQPLLTPADKPPVAHRR